MNTLLLILILAIPIFFVLLFGRLFWRQAQKTREARRQLAELDQRMSRAIWAGGTIIWATSAGQTGEKNGATKVELLMQIDLPGEKPYQTNVRWVVDAVALPQIQPGKNLSVKVDTDDRRRIYPNSDWARYWPWE